MTMGFTLGVGLAWEQFWWEQSPQNDLLAQHVSSSEDHTWMVSWGSEKTLGLSQAQVLRMEGDTVTISSHGAGNQWIS